MLKKLTCIFCALVFFFAVPMCVFADTVDFEDQNVSFSVPSGYEYITAKNASRRKDTAEKFGYSSKSIVSYMKNNSILLIAVNEESHSQFQLKSTATDFTKGVVSLSDVGEDERGEIGDLIFTDLQYSESKIGGKIYFKTVSEDAVIFSTIENGLLFTASYYGSDENSATTLVKGIVFKSTSSSHKGIGSSVMPLIIAVLMTVAALGVAVFVIVSLVNDWKSRDKNDDEEETKIRRRKF